MSRAHLPVGDLTMPQHATGVHNLVNLINEHDALLLSDTDLHMTHKNTQKTQLTTMAQELIAIMSSRSMNGRTRQSSYTT